MPMTEGPLECSLSKSTELKHKQAVRCRHNVARGGGSRQPVGVVALDIRCLLDFAKFSCSQLHFVFYFNKC